VIFCVYHETEELRLQIRIDEFELATRQAGHGWAVFDLINTFAHWFISRRYAAGYYRKPRILPTLMPKYLSYIANTFAAFRDRVAALPARYDNILINAVERCESLAQFVQLPRRTIKTDGDIGIWIKDVKQQLKSALQQGPVIIK